MPHKDSKNAKEWFKMADDDLKFAKAGFRETRIASDACFLSQQVVEKYLKGFLLSYGKEFGKTHDLIKLLKQCSLAGRRVVALLEDCKKLNKYYIPGRYPADIFTDYGETEGEDAIQSAERVVKFIQKLIKLDNEQTI
ncbi:MAG: HEPN domain-containing protein [Patescibacteria group bacterium]|nr:HEPN domain-containing protein [Patescibacteria group bacterium]